MLSDIYVLKFRNLTLHEQFQHAVMATRYHVDTESMDVMILQVNVIVFGTALYMEETNVIVVINLYGLFYCHLTKEQAKLNRKRS